MPDDFGLVTLAVTVIGLIDAVINLPVNRALIRIDTVTKQHFDTAWTMSLIRGSVVCIAVLLFSAFLYDPSKDMRIYFVLVVYSIFILALSAQNPKFVVFEKNLSYKYEISMLLIARVLSMIMGLLVAYVYQSFWALVISAGVTNITKLFLSYLFVPYLPKFGLGKFKEIWSFTGWLTIGSFIDAINQRFDKLLIGYTLEKSDLGIYEIGNDLASKPTNDIVFPIVRPLFPAFSSISDSKEKLINAYKKSQLVLFAVALPFGVGFSAIAESAVLIFMGNKWEDAIFIIQYLAIVFALQSLVSPASALAQATGNTKSIFIRQSIFLGIRLPMMIIGLLKFGIMGLVLARVITGIIYIFINLLMVKSILGLGLFNQIKVHWRACTSSILMFFVVTYFVQLLHAPSTVYSIINLLIAIVIGVVTYITTSIFMWFLAGKPDGAELQVLLILKKMTHKA